MSTDSKISETWDDRWPERVRFRIRQLGYSNVLEYFASNQNATFGELFGKLRKLESEWDTPVAYVQFEAVYFDEAGKAGKLKSAVADCLFRRLRRHLRRGWNLGRSLQMRRAEVFADLEVPIAITAHSPSFKDDIRRAIMAAAPPDDWCPQTPEDAILTAAIGQVWPANMRN